MPERLDRPSGGDSGRRRTRVLFVGGMGRSGTTLLERIVGSAEGAVALGEVLHMWERGVSRNERCGCGVPFRQCAFWSDVGDVAFGGWDRVSVARLSELHAEVNKARMVPRLLREDLPASLARAVDEYASCFAAVYQAATTVSGAGLVIDSSKQVSLPFLLARQPGLDLRVVQCIRDSRGVTYSWTKHVSRPEADGEWMPRYSPAEMSVSWSVHNAGFGLLPRVGVPLLRVRYEDLVRTPPAVVGEVLRFAGLPSDALAGTMVERHVHLQPAHTAAGNPMRFRSGWLEVRADHAWRQNLPRRYRALVTGLTLPLLFRYGYLGRAER